MSDPSQPLRAAVIGLGMMGRAHVRVWDELVEGVELVAVADTDPAALRESTDGRAARGYTDAASMLAAEDLDLVSVVVPTHSICRPRSPRWMPVQRAGREADRRARGEAEKMIDAARAAADADGRAHRAVQPRHPASCAAGAAGELGRIFEIRAPASPFPARIRDVGGWSNLARTTST